MSEQPFPPYLAVPGGEEETTMIHDTCPECGRKIEFSVADLIRCGHDDDHPRPKCECGYVTQIGHARRWDSETEEFVDV